MNSWPKKCKFKWRRCIAKCTDKSRSADMHKIDIAIRVSPTTYREMCGVFVMHIRRLVLLLLLIYKASLQAQLHILIVGKLSAGYTLLIFLFLCISPYTEINKIKIVIKSVGLSYQNRVGLLTYLVTTSADIAFAVSMSSQFIEKSEKQHWMATKRTVNYGLLFTKEDHALSKLQSLIRFYTRYISIFRNVTINWEARKQNTVALSSTAAEYMELSEASEEAIHPRQFIEETTDESKKMLIIISVDSYHIDNQRAERPAINPIFHVRTKHIDIRHHFIRDVMRRKNY
ncbi:Retrovirus-related Pol polyprotein from transposon TNT 1-94 [Trichinella nelsoni]|uniref:Retrovirus-related Pol polyprotein from transposon TNT 1-94 n=1 Tax=Trichinella nelsoni TaxID=6336 RepID=A0A0V0S562_9BILA|nr:Retrovirus-related Pol polyprotein from transposon TNT 1-94 [Trichinella nelsoni]